MKTLRELADEFGVTAGEIYETFTRIRPWPVENGRLMCTEEIEGVLRARYAKKTPEIESPAEPVQQPAAEVQSQETTTGYLNSWSPFPWRPDLKPVLWPRRDWPETIKAVDTGTIRQFDTGATRDTAQDKLDYEGFLAPCVLERFAEYMHKNRVQKDGSVRDSDNWQRGIPITVYMKSMWRHFFAVWKKHRAGGDPTDDLCGILFNVQGMMFELLNGQRPAESAALRYCGGETNERLAS
jgi:hypothetical protein